MNWEQSDNHLEKEAEFRLFRDYRTALYEAGAKFYLDEQRRGGEAILPNEVLNNLKGRLDEIIKFSGKTRDELKASLDEWKKGLEPKAQKGVETYLEHLFPPTGLEKE